MAEDSGQEKTENATPKRLREARKKGDIPKSKDLTMVIVMALAFAAMAISMAFSASQLKTLMIHAFTALSHTPITTAAMMILLEESVFTMTKVLLPIFIAAIVGALVVGYLQVGGLFTTEPLTPNFTKLNPIEGFKNIFKMVTLIELIKNIIKMSLVLYLAYSTINKHLAEILLLPTITVVESLRFTGIIVLDFFIKVSLLFLVIAIADLGVQRWNYMKRQRMSKDEVKREYKQEEGDPKIKGERRRLHREMATGDARQQVKKSDVVVTNPTHVAVAIQYDRENMAAPEVRIKGQDEMAEMIIQAAKDEGKPIVRNIPLAWSLLKIEEGDAISEELYEAVAEVLSFVYTMKQQQEQPQNETAQNDQKPPSGMQI